MTPRSRSACFLILAGAALGCRGQSPAVAPGAAPPPAEATGKTPIPPADVVRDVDGAERLIRDFLAPGTRSLDEAEAAERGPRALPAPPGLEFGNQGPAPLRSDVVRFPHDSSAALTRPAPLPEGPPYAQRHDAPAPPAPVALSTPGPVRWPSPDVNDPPPLPTLARPIPDRVPLGDPAPEASVAAALGTALPPPRATPAPFVRVDRPNPFEHAETAPLPSLVGESTALPPLFPRSPGR